MPTIHTFYGLLTQKAKYLYDYLFNPAVTIFPAGEVDTASDTPDDPMPDSTTGETPPTPMKISPTPFSQLVADYVNLDASFDDPGRLSAPEIQPSDYSTEPLDAPAFHASMLSNFKYPPPLPSRSTFFILFICSRPNAASELLSQLYWAS